MESGEGEEGEEEEEVGELGGFVESAAGGLGRVLEVVPNDRIARETPTRDLIENMTCGRKERDGIRNSHCPSCSLS